MLRIFAAGVFAGIVGVAAPNTASQVTFNKDVLPILQKNCQACHRPGEVAPMSFLTYRDVRPWAKAIKTAVIDRKMPPWFADPRYGHFSNERILADAEIKTLAAWADSGAAEGDAKERPAPVEFHEGWNIRPDIVVEMPNDFQVPATGLVDYQYVVVKTNFKEDMWVQAAELRPGNRAVVHHMKALVRPPGSSYMADAIPGIPFVPGKSPVQPANSPRIGQGGAGGTGMDMGFDLLAKYNPGVDFQTFTIADSAKFIPKGSDIVFEIHYSTIGKAATDRSKVGIMLAKAPPRRRYLTLYTLNAPSFTIKPGESNKEVRQEVKLQEDAEVVWFQPHMHLRGKDFEVQAEYPSGEKQILLKSKWDFNWQLGYDLEKPLLLPKGTRLMTIAHFDNSANNPTNPDPAAEIHMGPQSGDEMSLLFLSVLADAHSIKPPKFFPVSGTILPVD